MVPMRNRGRHFANRGRGRPPGSGRPDQLILYEIALLRASDPQPEITTAVRRVIEQREMHKNTNTVRRVRKKYIESEPMHGVVAFQHLQAAQYAPIVTLMHPLVP